MSGVPSEGMTLTCGCVYGTDRFLSRCADHVLMEAMGDLHAEIERQDAKHGPFEGTPLGRSRLALACLADEVREAEESWRHERPSARTSLAWRDTRTEVLQVAAVAMRAIRDAFTSDRAPAVASEKTVPAPSEGET